MGIRLSPKQLSRVLVVLLPIIPVFEGVVQHAYPDQVKVWTICSGHTAGVHKGQTATQAQCQGYTQQDITSAVQQVAGAVNTPLTDGEYIAYGDLVYNEGIGTFEYGGARTPEQRRTYNSLAKRINAGRRTEACEALSLYDKAGGKPLPGLTARRAWERAQCLKDKAQWESSTRSLPAS